MTGRMAGAADGGGGQRLMAVTSGHAAARGPRPAATANDARINIASRRVPVIPANKLEQRRRPKTRADKTAAARRTRRRRPRGKNGADPARAASRAAQ